jgi:hypothetical protein
MSKELAEFVYLLMVPNRVACFTAIRCRCGRRCVCLRSRGTVSLNQKPSKPGILLPQRVDVAGFLVTPKGRLICSKGVFDNQRTRIIGRFVSPK